MALSTGNRVDAQIHTHVGHNPEELVFRIGDAQGDNKLGRIGSEDSKSHSHLNMNLLPYMQHYKKFDTNIFSEVEMMEVVPICSAHKAKIIGPEAIGML
jgi:hypothetical protein